MRMHLPPSFYLYNYTGLFAKVAVVAAISVIVYTILLGGLW
ncbi:hypothetical protein [Ferirhizobium litorale]|nr:hypothetical protein [Fererhizobium litorale]